MTDSYDEKGFRSYEVYQRERVGETTNLVDPRALIADDYLRDPFTVPGLLREHYPCYRDWIANRFWVTRYDDVTSLFVDDANFESRPLTAAYGASVTGRNLAGHDEAEQLFVELADERLELALTRVLDDLAGAADLASEFADRLSTDLLGAIYGFGEQTAEVMHLIAQIRAGAGWSERDRVAGLEAFRALRLLVSAMLVRRREAPGGDVMTALADAGATSDDVVVTLAESDIESLPGSIANLWWLLLHNPEQLETVRADPRLMKFAYLESLRHSPVVLTADRFARHEVERFGRLIPHGALVHLSAAAANRDPRQFAEPDEFQVERKDLCQREPRGQYRADGLPAAITFGHGKPSRLPALPREAPRSRYALTRDIAVRASRELLERFSGIELQPGADSPIECRRLGGPYRCWQLPVVI